MDHTDAVRVDVLGPLQITVDGASRQPGRAQVRRLVSALAVAGGEVLSADVLADVLWPDGLPADPRAALGVAVSRLRSELEPHRDVLEATPGGWRLDAGTDVADFLAATESSNGGTSPEDRLAALRNARRLWRGTPFEEIAGASLVSSQRVLLEQRWRAATAELAELLVARGDHVEAVEVVVDEHAGDPTDERLAVAAARALAGAGRRSEALNLLQRTRDALRDELGIDPTARFADAEREILRGAGGIGRSAPGGDQFEERGVFVGRADVLATLSTGTHLVTGEAGSGKSALLREAARRSAGEPALVVVPQHPDRPMAAVAELVEQLVDRAPPGDDPLLLAALARLTPAVREADEPLNALTRDVLAEQVHEYLTSALGDAVLFIDDAQWLDRFSAELLARLETDGITLVVGARPAWSPIAAPLLDVLADRRIALDPLDDDEATALVEAAGVGRNVEATARRLREKSGGNALFLTLLVDLVVEGAGDDLPPNVLVAVQQRLDGLPASARRALDVAAAFGDDVPVAALVDLVGATEADIERAVDAHILWRSGDEVHFLHQLVADGVYELVTHGRRVELHDEVGRWLEMNDAPAGEVARHYDEASSIDPHRAAEAHHRAAVEAAAVWEWDLVDQHTAAGRRLLGGDRSPLVAQLIVLSGDAQRVLHRGDDLPDLMSAAEIAREAGDDELFARAVTAVAVHSWELAATVDESLVGLHDEACRLDLPPALAAEVRAVASTFAMSDQYERARRLYAEAFDLALDLPDATDQAVVLRFARWGFSHPADLPLFCEAVKLLTDIAGDDLDLFWSAATNRFATGVITADRAAVDTAIADLRTKFEATKRPHHEWDMAHIEAAYAHLDGDFDRADVWLDRTLELALTSIAKSWALPIYGASLAGVRRDQRRLAEVLPLLETSVVGEFTDSPPWRSMAAASAAAAGDGARVRAELAKLRHPDHRPRPDLVWTGLVPLLTDAIEYSGDREFAAELLAEAQAYSGRMSWAGVISYGPLDSALARLAVVAGDDPAPFEARAVAVAAAMERRLESPELATWAG